MTRRLMIAAACVGLAACSSGGGESAAVRGSADAAPPASATPNRSRLAVEGTAPTTTIPARPVTTRASRSRPTVPRAAAPQASARPSAVQGDIFDALARCESGMNPRANTGNGFYGAFQFTLSTWRSLGMSGNPVDHDYATQKAAAQRLVARSGWGQFPTCSRRIGAR